VGRRRRRGKPRIKRAVIVGIDRYQGDGLNLQGCVADALDFYKMLKKFYGFRAKNIKLLLNENATKANILANLNWMLSRTRKRQEAVYFQSGHGAQIPDTNGDETDRLDECIIPHDFNWNNVIVDDEIAQIFRQLPERAYLSMICDTCYSGGAARGVGRKLIENPEAIKYTDLPVSHFGITDSNPNIQRHVLLSG